MLSPTARLRRSSEIGRVLRDGRCYKTPQVRLYVLMQPKGSPARAACVVSKRVSASSVVRHRYQRLLRVVARQVLSELHGRFQGDMVWLAEPSITQIHNLAELKTSVDPILTKLLTTL